MTEHPDFYNFYKGKTVFVTGAGGFIGSHLTEALVQAGAKVKALVRYNANNRWGWLDTLQPEVLDHIEVLPGDIRDGEFVRKLTKDTEIGFHLAALISIPYSYDAPGSYVETNITGTLNVLQAVRQTGIERLVTTSTSEVYGTAQYVPIDEKHPLQGQSPYSATKIGADQIAESFYRSFNLPVVILRPFNTYGPRQSMRAIIPTLLMQGLTGTEVNVGNLTPTRDFNYVLDTVQAFLRCGKTPEAEGHVLNAGTGTEISIADLIRKIENLLGKKLNVVQVEERLRPEKSEVFRLCASIEKARKILGYEPQYSLEEGLARTLEWCQAQDASRQYTSRKVALYHV
jgi:NAD dependent epimerase/dehydratase